MTATLTGLFRADRDRLTARLRELAELDRLLREPGRQAPPPVPPARPASAGDRASTGDLMTMREAG